MTAAESFSEFKISALFCNLHVNKLFYAFIFISTCFGDIPVFKIFQLKKADARCSKSNKFFCNIIFFTPSSCCSNLLKSCKNYSLYGYITVFELK
jgi:hypothetical protein